MERIVRYLLLFIIIFLSGCGAGSSSDAIRFGIPGLPDVLHPLFATDAVSARIGRLLYTPLVDFDDSQRPVPRLASWTRIDPQRYVFTLSDNAPHFSDGRPVGAHDVLATYRFVLDVSNGSPHRGLLSVIDRLRLVDEQSIEFQLSRPDPNFPSYLTLGIVPAESLEEMVTKDHPPIGSGHFVLAGPVGNDRLRLQRRQDGQVIEFVEARDPLVRLLKLLRGEIHLLQNDMPPELFSRLAEEKTITVVNAKGTNYSYLGFNLEDPATADLRVRRAIAHAIDRKAIATHLFRERVELAESLFSPSHWLGLELPSHEHDPDKARNLLKEAGYDEQQPLHIEYKTSSDPFRLRVAAIIQAQLAEVGIKLELKSYDWGTFYGDIKGGNFQMFSLTWVGMKSPDSFRYLFHSESVPPKGANRGRYRSAGVDVLIEAGEAATGEAAEINLYQRLQRLLWEELPYIPLWYEHNVAAISHDIEGYQLAADGNFDGLVDTHWSNL